MPLMDFKAKNKKNGAPKNEVTTPIGTSMGLRIFLAIMSQKSKNNPPATAEVGIKMALLEVLSSILKVCGMISPTKLIMPVNATEKPISKDEAMSKFFFDFSTSTPRDFASSSPLKMIFSSCLFV